jgi:hypothetical protein
MVMDARARLDKLVERRRRDLKTQEVKMARAFEKERRTARHSQELELERVRKAQLRETEEFIRSVRPRWMTRWGVAIAFWFAMVLWMILMTLASYLKGRFVSDVGSDGLGVPIFAMALALSIGGALALDFLTATFFAARARRWMINLPFPIDIDGYHQMLSQRRRRRSVEVVVQFEDLVSKPDRTSFTDAVAVLMPTGFTEWTRDGTALRVISCQFETSRWESSDHGEGETIYDNSLLHTFFKRFVQRCLPVLEGVQPVMSLSVRAIEYDY